MCYKLLTSLASATTPAYIRINLGSFSENHVYEVARGQTIYVIGAENPTTGFTWNYAGDYNHNCGPDGSFQMVSEFYPADNPRNYVGVGGTR